MSVFPKRFTVWLRKRVEDAEDAHGNPVKTWADPVDRDVYGWGPAGFAGVDNILREQVDWELDLYADAIDAVNNDKIVVNGTEFFVRGYPQDFNHGPFGFRPGVRVKLARTEG